MKTKERVIGMNFLANLDRLDYEICAKYKIHVHPLKNSIHCEKDILGLVHLDICGLTNVKSLGGARYFITFTNARYTETRTLRNRSEILKAFKSYKLKVEKQTGQRIKKL